MRHLSRRLNISVFVHRYTTCGETGDEGVTGRTEHRPIAIRLALLCRGIARQLIAQSSALRVAGSRRSAILAPPAHRRNALPSPVPRPGRSCFPSPVPHKLPSENFHCPRRIAHARQYQSSCCCAPASFGSSFTACSSCVRSPPLPALLNAAEYLNLSIALLGARSQASR